jgi:hypothetical protein
MSCSCWLVVECCVGFKVAEAVWGVVVFGNVKLWLPGWRSGPVTCR